MKIENKYLKAIIFAALYFLVVRISFSILSIFYVTSIDDCQNTIERLGTPYLPVIITYIIHILMMILCYKKFSFGGWIIVCLYYALALIVPSFFDVILMPWIALWPAFDVHNLEISKGILIPYSLLALIFLRIMYKKKISLEKSAIEQIEDDGNNANSESSTNKVENDD